MLLLNSTWIEPNNDTIVYLELIFFLLQYRDFDFKIHKLKCIYLLISPYLT